jgi:predicted RNase H-like HicB family nuclease
MKEYTVIIEGGDTNFSAYVLDFDGCVATGKTVDEVTKNMKRAIALHIEGMLDDGLAAPEPLKSVTSVKIAV